MASAPDGSMRYTDADPHYVATSAHSSVALPVFVPAPARPPRAGITTSQASGAPRLGEAPRPGFAERMLRSFGWKEGEGLGARSDGIAKPIEPVAVSGRSGLGYAHTLTPTRHDRAHVDDMVRALLATFDATPLGFATTPRAVWLDGATSAAASLRNVAGHVLRKPRLATDSLRTDALVVREGPRDALRSRADHGLYCDARIVAEIFEAKSCFDGLPRRAFEHARTATNPYEDIRRAVFQNRAALKMAELDHALGLLPPQRTETPLLFADVCAGPGGFTEYVCWKAARERRTVRGLGFTLRASCDWQLGKFGPDAPTRGFSTHYGADGTGDVYCEDNMRAFARDVDVATQGRGVALMMADGGFSTDGEENYQEAAVARLVLCQFLTSLLVVGQGGTFVCKIFDVFTPVTASLLYLLSLCYDRMCIVKPYTSRPANSERYVCFAGLRERRGTVVDHVVAHLFVANGHYRRLGTSAHIDVVSLLDGPPDPRFLAYLRASNDAIAQRQVQTLRLLYTYMEDPSLTPVGPRRDETVARCLAAWGIPSSRRDAPRRDAPRHEPADRPGPLVLSEPAALRGSAPAVQLPQAAPSAQPPPPLQAAARPSAALLASLKRRRESCA